MKYFTHQRKIRFLKKLSPTRIIVTSFALIILIGTLLLDLPFASNDGASIGFLNAFFTATSATCVTGLVVADTATQWTIFGQIVILVLIQTGALGIVTLATFFTVVLGRKVSLSTKLLAQESISDYSFRDVLDMIRTIVKITAVMELIGAVFLAAGFVPEYGWKGIYFAFFHSISSFCNAGFDLIGNYESLTPFNGNPFIIYPSAALIVFGGLGFIVWKDLIAYRKQRFFYLHTKVVLIMAGSLILFGTLFFFVSEYSNPGTMGNLNLYEKINAAFFHSVSSRTAGFNSVPTGELTEVSKMVTIFLMFIGAAPGSTGGGIKVTTFGIILIAILSNIRGEKETIILHSRVSQAVVNKALSIIGLSMVLIFIMTIIMISVEKVNFINILFEVTSAFGTVGLSTGITPGLHSISKVLLILTMFIGRVGPLTFALAIAMRAHKKTQDAVFPEGKIMVG